MLLEFLGHTDPVIPDEKLIGCRFRFQPRLFADADIDDPAGRCKFDRVSDNI